MVIRTTNAPDARLRSVEGRHNKLVKELRKAFSQAELTPDGYCAIEGAKILEEAIRSGLRIKTVFFSASAASKSAKLLPQLGSHVETLLLPDALFSSIVASDSPQGIAALVRLKTFSVEEVIAKSSLGPLVVLAGIQDPGNLGTILRSAEAFGASGVLLGEGTVSPFNSKVVRGSAGSAFRLPIVQTKLNDAILLLKQNAVRLLATSSHKGVPLYEAKLSGPVAIFIGNEGAGVPRNMFSAMDEMLAIPHSDQVESLNAGIAASILLYEIAKQRGAAAS